MKKYLVLFLFSAAGSIAVCADIVAQWNFNGVPPDTMTSTGSTNASVGSGSLRVIGGTTFSFAGGNTNDPAASDNSAINISAYPGNSISNKSAGIRFVVDTTGYTNLSISWAQRESATGSRYHRLQYTMNGTDFVDFPEAFFVSYTNNDMATLVFTNQAFDLSSISGIADNPLFAFQIVSEFVSTATGSGAASYTAAVTGSTYSSAGTVRFELMTVSGTSVGIQNATPTISSITNITMRANTSYPPIPFTISDAETAAASLTIDKSSSDLTLFPLSGIILGGSESNRTVALIPAPDQSGSANIRLTVIDDGGRSNSTVFSVTVIPANTPPTISAIANQATTVDVPIAAIPFTIGDAEVGASNLTITAFSSNLVVLPQAGISLGGSNGSRTISLVPAAGQLGNASVSVTVSDGVFSTNRTFVLSVLPSEGTLFYEPFNYPDGSLVSNSLGLWQTHSGTSGQLDTEGQRLFVTADNSEDVNARLKGEPYTPVGGSTLYYSFRFSAYNLPTVLGDYFAHFKDNASNFRAKFFVSTTNAPIFFYRIGIANGASFPTNAGYAEVPVDLALDESVFVVVRYNVGAGITTLWMNPTNETDMSYTASDVLNSTNTITQFAIRESSFQGDLYVDDIRVATTFGEALGILPPPSVSLRVARSGGDILIAWPVSAAGYTLQVNTNLNTTNWQDVTQVPIAIGNDNVVTVPAITESEFFRLSR